MKTKPRKRTGKYRVIYIAGKYSRGMTASSIEKNKNLREMDGWYLQFVKQGYAPIHPVRNTACIEDIVAYKKIIAMDLAILSKCDAIFMSPGFEESAGAVKELAHAKKMGLEIIYWNGGYHG